MKCIISDSGTIISLSMNGLFQELKGLKKIFNGKFIITKDVKREIIDKPLTIKKFELEALRIQELLKEKVLEMPESLGINEENLENETIKIMSIANSTFETGGNYMHLIDSGEASCLALGKILNEKKIENVLAVDERTTRLLCEKPEKLRWIMEGKFHTKLKSKKENYKFFDGFKIIRSIELIYVAYKKGATEIKDGEIVLDALLYALKFKGASVSDDEIREIKSLR